MLKPKQPQQLDERQLTQAARAAQLRRQTECWKEVLEVCKKHNCQLVPQIVVTGTQIASQIVVTDA